MKEEKEEATMNNKDGILRGKDIVKLDGWGYADSGLDCYVFFSFFTDSISVFGTADVLHFFILCRFLLVLFFNKHISTVPRTKITTILDRTHVKKRCKMNGTLDCDVSIDMYSTVRE
jgi:hypothetical protein